MLAGALIVAGTERRPTGQVSVARETAHVHAELGYKHLGRALIDPGDRVQLHQVLGEWGEPALDFLAHHTDRFLQIIHVGQQLMTRNAWCGRKRPASAWRKAGSFLRNLPRARSASTSGSVVPCTSASSIARPDTPRMLVATDASLIPASCSSLCRRLAARVRSWISTRRCRVRSRSSRIGAGGTKLPRSSPHSRHCAIHTESLTSVLRPGTCLM